MNNEKSSTVTEQAKTIVAASKAIGNNGVITPGGFLPYGQHKGVIDLITIVPNGEQPAFYVRIKTASGAAVTHITRLHNPVSRRIGLGEIRCAFPEQLVALDDRGLMIHLLQNTKSFIGCAVDFTIAPQIDAKTHLPMRDGKGGDYFNVRLISALHDIADEAKAASIVDMALNAVDSVNGSALPEGWKPSA